MQHSSQPWNALALPQTLAERTVHIWQVSLQTSTPRFLALQSTLAPDERERAQKFHFEKDRSQWIIARGFLRQFLGFYLHMDAQLISFRYNDYGKPFLAPLGEKTLPLQFNLSHSHGLALYAFAYQRLLGIDLESMRSNVDYAALVQHSFSPLEQSFFAALPAEQKRQAFFWGWTRKEAYIKARGLGLSYPLDSFDVSLLPGEAFLLHDREDRKKASRWSMSNIPLGPEYAGALVAEGDPCKLLYWEWQESLLDSNLCCKPFANIM